MNDNQAPEQNPNAGAVISPLAEAPAPPAPPNLAPPAPAPAGNTAMTPAPTAMPAGKDTTASAPNPNSTQNALLVSEIRDGIVIMNDGTFRAVIMCRSVNFDLMSPQEQEAVEFSFQGFLNSLYFPVQIFIRSQKVDLRPYLEKINTIRTRTDNMLLGLLMDDYIAFLADIASQTNIMDKRFYLIIQYPDPDEQDIKSSVKQSTGFFTGLVDMFAPKNPTVTIDEAQLEKAKTELRNRVQAAMQGLAQAGVQSVPLNTEELIELYYDAYNPDTATRQQLKNFNDLTAPVVTKASGPGPQATESGGAA